VIRHFVMVKFRPDIASDEKAALFDDLAGVLGGLC